MTSSDSEGTPDNPAWEVHEEMLFKNALIKVLSEINSRENEEEAVKSLTPEVMENKFHEIATSMMKRVFAAKVKTNIAGGGDGGHKTKKISDLLISCSDSDSESDKEMEDPNPSSSSADAEYLDPAQEAYLDHLKMVKEDDDEEMFEFELDAATEENKLKSANYLAAKNAREPLDQEAIDMHHKNIHLVKLLICLLPYVKKTKNYGAADDENLKKCKSIIQSVLTGTYE